MVVHKYRGVESEELEDEKQARRMSWRESKEKGWLLQLVEAHPVVKALPTTLKQGLVECLAEDLKKILGCNCRRRRRLRRGFIVHLFAGEEAGYTLSRAFSDSGGDQRMLVEVDVKKEKRWKMDPTAC